MSRSLFLVLIGCFSVSCSPNTGDKHSVAAIQETLPVPIDSPTYYFPIDSTEREQFEEQSVDFLVNSWYSKMLFALREPVLYNYRGDEEVYRFTWLRTFDNPAAIRIQKKGSSIRLFAKVSSGAGGYEPGEVKMDTAFKVSQKQWEEFKVLVERARFWKLPTTIKHEGKDGSQWILEGVSNRQYHCVDRWSPTDDENLAAFKEACEYLLSLSKVPTSSNRGYY